VLEEKRKLIKEVLQSPEIGFDVETTGLYWQKSDVIFGAAIFSDSGSFYADLRTNDLDLLLSELIQYRGEAVFSHNAKFEMHFLNKEKAGVLDLPWWCTQGLYRLVNNLLPSYSLADLGPRLGYEKDKTVEAWITANKAYDIIKIPGKKNSIKNKKFIEVPLDIISKYCIRDAEITYRRGQYQKNAMRNYPILQNEIKLTKTLYKMEEIGLNLDTDHATNGVIQADKDILAAKQRFKTKTGEDFIDSGLKLALIFDTFNIQYPRTALGRPSFTKKTLPNIKHPIVDDILEARRAYKEGYTYYANYLHLRGHDNKIHGSFRQGGTATGRMSASDPNLQNITKDKKGAESNIRKSFTASPGFIFASIDMDQFEYRMALNESGEMELINKVLAGLDVHTATAEMLKGTRDAAKTINFLLLYGGGPVALKEELNCTIDEARVYFKNYHANLKKMSAFFKRCEEDVNKLGYITNCFGRKVRVPKNEAYKAVNYKIQGGTADWIKIALVNCDEYLLPFESRIVTQVHDEINFEVREDEMFVIPELKKLMENVAPTKYLPYTCGVKVGTNLKELVKYQGEL